MNNIIFLLCICTLSTIIGYWLMIREQTFISELLLHAINITNTIQSIFNIPQFITIIILYIIMILIHHNNVKDKKIGIYLFIIISINLLIINYGTHYKTTNYSVINNLLFGSSTIEAKIYDYILISIIYLLIIIFWYPIMRSSIYPTFNKYSERNINKIFILIIIITFMYITKIMGSLLSTSLMIGSNCITAIYTKLYPNSILISIVINNIIIILSIITSNLYFKHIPYSGIYTIYIFIIYILSLIIKKIYNLASIKINSNIKSIS